MSPSEERRHRKQQQAARRTVIAAYKRALEYADKTTLELIRQQNPELAATFNQMDAGITWNV